jgi:N-glycosylase/DNA lyase
LKNFSDRLASKINVTVKQEADLPVETVVMSTVATKRPLDEDDKKEELLVQATETVVTRRRSKRQRR